MPVHALPGFDEGWVTVQDASAQGCMTWLEPKMANRSSTCVPRRGKTTHILEVAPQASVMAVDVDEQRLSRVYDNLKRLGMKAQVKQGDGRKPTEWCGETQFDRILLDAPARQPALFVVTRTLSGCVATVILRNLRSCNPDP